LENNTYKKKLEFFVKVHNLHLEIFRCGMNVRNREHDVIHEGQGGDEKCWPHAEHFVRHSVVNVEFGAAKVPNASRR
jgi:hypothetical protein